MHSVLPASSGKIDAPKLALGARLLRQRRRRFLSLAVAGSLLLLIALLPAWLGSQFQLARIEVAATYIIAAIGLNLSLGYAGELTLGHPVVMAAGAYIAAMLSALLGWNFVVALPLGILGGILAGLLIMIPGIRVQGWYLALITLFAVLALPRVVILGEAWTGGEFGLTGVVAPEIFGWKLGGLGTFEFVVGCLALTWALSSNLMRSSWGYRFRALRDAKRAAESSGINLAWTRFAVYFVSSVPPALAGALLAYTEQYVNADSFGISLALLLLTGVVLGGGGTVWGPVVGMLPLVGISFWAGPFSQYNAIALGLGLLVGALLFTNGLVPAILPFLDRNTGLGDIEARGGSDVAEYLEPRPDSAPAPDDPRSTSDLIVRIDGITKRFGGVKALANVSIEFQRGALIGLVGPNGSGKSTLLNTLSGFIRPDEGTIAIDGRSIAGLRVDAIAQKGVGRTFQVPQLVDDATALENIEIGLIALDQTGVLASALRLPATVKREEARRQRALEVFQELGLPAAAIDLPASALPLGLKRIVEVGRAIASKPSLLLLDEPAAGLNDEERHQLGLLLQRLKRSGMTVLVVEHNVPFVMTFCEELILLEAGAVTCRSAVGSELPERIVNYLNYAIDPVSLAAASD
jgi:branched-chain amino acid transport system permease protein